MQAVVMLLEWRADCGSYTGSAAADIPRLLRSNVSEQSRVGSLKLYLVDP